MKVKSDIGKREGLKLNNGTGVALGGDAMPGGTVRVGGRTVEVKVKSEIGKREGLKLNNGTGVALGGGAMPGGTVRVGGWAVEVKVKSDIGKREGWTLNNGTGVGPGGADYGESGDDMNRASHGRTNYRGEPLAMRLERFGGEVVRVCEAIPDTRSGRHLADQLLRSGTAVGAHYSEGQGAQSRKDFIHKFSLALKEAREARYWLGVARHADYLTGPNTESILQEASELIAILQASQTTARKSNPDP